jgi:hypothetical protein
MKGLSAAVAWVFCVHFGVCVGVRVGVCFVLYFGVCFGVRFRVSIFPLKSLAVCVLFLSTLCCF